MPESPNKNPPPGYNENGTIHQLGGSLSNPNLDGFVWGRSSCDIDINYFSKNDLNPSSKSCVSCFDVSQLSTPYSAFVLILEVVWGSWMKMTFKKTHLFYTLKIHKIFRVFNKATKA